MLSLDIGQSECALLETDKTGGKWDSNVSCISRAPCFSRSARDDV